MCIRDSFKEVKWRAQHHIISARNAVHYLVISSDTSIQALHADLLLSIWWLYLFWFQQCNYQNDMYVTLSKDEKYPIAYDVNLKIC